MLFYKINTQIENSDILPKPDDHETEKKFAFTLNEKSEALFQKCRHQGYIFVADVKNNNLTLCAILKSKANIHLLISQYQDLTKLIFQPVNIEEITFKTFYSFLCIADRQDYISSDDDILKYFDLEQLSYRCNIDYREAFVSEEINKDTLISKSKQLLAKETLLPEIERIYSGKAQPDVMGHPVHYMVRCNDHLIKKIIYEILLDALYDNGRIENRRYVYTNWGISDNVPDDTYDALYKSCEGGAVIVQYTMDEEDDTGIYARCGKDVIIDLCQMALKYRYSVLTIFCISNNTAKTRTTFIENLDNLSLIELYEDVVFGETAKEYLRHLAKCNHVECNSSLFNEIKNIDRGFTPSNLREIFSNWYDLNLRTAVYPQYKEAHTVKADVQKAQPKGNAIDELNKMIGLSEAKSVISKALNYYKVQKLYKSKGIETDHPSMHMIFSGNPGTAKTTVARLFAQIMKDNKLLTKGDLYEVGRADLVGKYVGWTAQMVKNKFKAARGSVLFIDEAYSLVDEANGLFGDEAINTIVQEMENNRDNMVVIFAGYPDKMEEFLRKNPGLRSRIAFHVPFSDYDTDELCQIAKLMNDKKGITITAEALEKLKSVFDAARKKSDFGNGRYVRNVLEKAKMNQASRILNIDADTITTEEILTIEACDIDVPSVTVQKKRRIGF